MATKEQWVEMLGLKLDGGDAPAQLQGRNSPQECELYLTLAFNDILVKAWMEDPSLIDDYIKAATYPLLNDTTRGERYIQLDGGVLPLPGNAGIHQVRQPLNPNQQFALIEGNSKPIFSELEVSSVDNKVDMYPEGSRIYFGDQLPKIVENLFVKTISSFDSLADDDEVVVPGGNNMLVFDTVYRLMGKTAASVNQSDMVDKQI